ncbi:MAG: amidophosphoribosyltransferase [Desulfobacterales bacterium]|nr:amidophosphoribosyltransferase [Desulfobacterales bacterium]
MNKMMTEPKDACGVFGVHGHPEAASLTYFGLYALQHRGQESAGISVARKGRIEVHKGMGLVPEIFKKEDLTLLEGEQSVGHVRYSTTGESSLSNAQPFVVRHKGRSYAVAHNGNLTNAHHLKARLEESGSIFQSTMDSEVALHQLIRNVKGSSLEEGLVKTAQELEGAFSIIFLTGKGEMIGMKDPNGFRPLCLGRLGQGYILASESCALDLVEAEFVRELAPGEIVIIDDDGVKSLLPEKKVQPSTCIFEYIYFARPDSTISGLNVYQMRKAFGRKLAEESPVDADFLMPFPDSGNYAALGYSEVSGIPFEMAMIRNHYVGRSFIQPTQSMREFAVRIKLNPVKEQIKGKEIIIIEDSIIRGTTSRTRVKALRELGAKKIHMRVSCPPTRFPCYYGIDFPDPSKLIAAQMETQAMAKHLGLDTLHYLSIEGMLEATGVSGAGSRFCKACFDGIYPVPVCEGISKECLEP